MEELADNSGVNTWRKTMIDFTKIYRVTKAVSNRFEIDSPDGIISCYSRKKVKKDYDILVGDLVRLEQIGSEIVIASVEKRKNSLIRPAVANIDQIVILVSPEPQPDFLLIDKMILNCHKKKIDCILCVSKKDIYNLTSDLQRQYSSAVKAIISVCAINNDISEIKPLLNEKITCLAGQSAVGKSSLTNAISGKKMSETGNISEKIKRGKNTTTAAALIKISDNGFIVDTPGFSMLDVFEIDANELDLYYDEYFSISDKCKYHRCSHIAEPDCEVKRRVATGELSRERYDRYVIIHNSLKQNKKQINYIDRRN